MDNRRPPVPVVIARGVINEASLTCGLRQEVKAPVETTYVAFNNVPWIPTNRRNNRRYDFEVYTTILNSYMISLR